MVLADEPTGALDSTTSMEVMDILLDSTIGTGKTLVVTTHDDVGTLVGVLGHLLLVPFVHLIPFRGQLPDSVTIMNDVAFIGDITTIVLVMGASFAAALGVLNLIWPWIIEDPPASRTAGGSPAHGIEWSVNSGGRRWYEPSDAVDHEGEPCTCPPRGGPRPGRSPSR